MLSPTAPFTEGAPYGDIRKVIVLMSDGENALQKEAPEPGQKPYEASFTNYSSYGSLTYGRLEAAVGSANDVDKVNVYLDERMTQVCTNIKATGIEIFVIAFGVENQRSRQLLEDCATNGDYYIAVNRSENLDIPFHRVATKLSNLRLTR
ncbi:hypothetical protein GCM10007276_34630 [Agaricicola taiwanensis]|uniref:VWFA domain-containing protein n=1 Tax=Agaricicola taiwanensis TaxID=591372 RepID=A0A8J2YMW2_9RHOB|nr:hypothetical protein [Agaricicola taiwanensis]GGE54681.1 hypothetical protein GCM10007276_34630 [Agaricicola taiwanensis]